jgi:hypothetical protein
MFVAATWVLVGVPIVPNVLAVVGLLAVTVSKVKLVCEQLNDNVTVLLAKLIALRDSILCPTPAPVELAKVDN